MNTIKKLCSFIEKYMAVEILIIAALSLFCPKYFVWVKMSWINYLLIFVMFGMGLTLNTDDFKEIFKRPKNLIIGCFAQYLIMPLLAAALGIFFGLDKALFVGVILVGACPGGTSSNVITYLSKGDVAFSVGMTAINTLIAPIVTPFIVYLFLKTVVDINVLGMFISILNVVIFPIAAGLILNKVFPQKIKKFVEFLPTFSIIAISTIVVAVVSHNSKQILQTAYVIFLVVILHNVLGYVCGYLLGKLLKLDTDKVKALSIEIGMQNSGLATSLASTSFQSLALATVPGAIFSVWHNISGAIIAWTYKKLK